MAVTTKPPTKPTGNRNIVVPDQTGTLAVVTGANSGIGLETARELAGAGAEVVLAVRNASKGAAAVADICSTEPNANVRVAALDLSSLASVAAFAQAMSDRARPIDLLVNNAGIMGVPKRQVTEDGFELQLGTNFLGHFALTSLLLPLIRRAPAPRVVSISSNAARFFGRIKLDDLQSERRYNAWLAYGQSKLADLVFAFELSRRSAANGWNVMSNAAHPGSTHTNLTRTGPNLGKREHGEGLIAFLARAPGVSQSAPQGALPTLYAATSPDAEAAGYYGPDGFQEMSGLPTSARIPRRALDTDVASELWRRAEQLTGAPFPA
jgi:NAD(P)-dependent dehydrogenase (short-subunit alcohol dehydrogenase family)